jgi:Ni,Fe-hydrogenase III small subunit/formate hydrogenlyase subunit 6/NADH:ubiquinone oxidoreductase subunit I
MLNILRTSWRTGRVTSQYPDIPTVAEGYRGRPLIDPERCACSGACAIACPSGAITLTVPSSRERRWELDLATCVFCGLCADACPESAIAMTQDYELAVRDRADLVTRVTHSPPETGITDFTPTGPLREAENIADRLGRRIRGLLKRSLHIRHMDAGSDNSSDWEISALLNPVYDIQRLGIDIVASPRHADMLLVTGAVTRHLEPALKYTFDAMPAPAMVIAVGSDACGGGLLHGSYAVLGGVDKCLPVDIYVPGDPPRPEALIQGLLLALGRYEQKLRRTEITVPREVTAK